MPTATDIVQGWVDATNNSDPQALRALFAPDAVLVDTGRRFHGVDAIMRWSDSDLIGVNARIQVDRIDPKSDGATLHSTVHSNGFNGHAKIGFKISDGLIQNVHI
ncbi:nuclear transport factor 2 family protein [Actinoplanes sp. KI2]|uniref:nuclear transport factor 2 family protein n=1 Tax=Actinoplanes sp. KI2 TaxID=2983315 RepID=UPI0021D60547|nr:nuclear transport factor 2 family protein [Actinoplanes sp. KI2]MCU7729576.1 nuclear transport factor 2 family protein [Actinoplanes sp. KI2]